MTPTVTRRVVKVGGSLLTWNQLPNALHQWLTNQRPAVTVMLAGGGPWAELLRQAANRFHLAESVADLLCIQAMSVTATLLAELCECKCSRSLADLHSLTETAPGIVFDVQDWLSDDSTRDLPKTWDVTSDSIAARLATELQADELVLLKSGSAASDDLSKLAEADYVDQYFPTAAAKIPVIRYVSLRASQGLVDETHSKSDNGGFKIARTKEPKHGKKDNR